ncbi:chemotaxis protein CheD [Candidatus Bathyarchaeota archaeon]|nr:chemotaxis protein CheD [Candidatus Bathyarchaeota archaeon]
MCGNKKMRIGMAEMFVAGNPTIITTTVGSCIALCMYDPVNRIGGMVHIVLPRKTDYSREEKTDTLIRYADKAVPALLSRLISKGAKKEFIRAKMAGGANMFPMFTHPILEIGKNNAEAVKKKLAELGVPLVAEDVGGNHGRIVEFDVGSGIMRVNTINKGEKEL